MAADNPAFTADQEIHSGVFTISNNVEERPNQKKKAIKENNKDEKFWMGWYRQIQEQCGLKNDHSSYLGTILLLTIPSLLLPSLLASPSPPIGIYMPPLAWIAGRLFEKTGLPPTPAMLIVGLAFRSVGWFELTTVWKRAAALTRYVAVAVVLLKGGLALAHLPNVPLMIIPCTFEATSIAALSYFLLGFPWKWGYVFGFAMSAASSSVSAEKLTQLKAGSYGTKELYGLILPTSTVENIYSITAFTATLTLALIDEGSWSDYVIRGVVPILLGPVYALSWGFLCSLFPNRKDEYMISKRSVLALLGGCLVYLGAKEYSLAPGGPLGTMLTGASLSFFWRAQGWTETNNPVLGVVSVAWNVLEPALFSLVGAEVDVFQITPRDIVLACAIMAVSMLVRLIFFYLVIVIRKQFTWREIVVGLIVWFPKATVLAALSPQVLDNVRKARFSPTEEVSEEFTIARMVLLASVMEMIVTAPIGYVALSWLGEKLLPKSKVLDKEAAIRLTINEAQFNSAPVTRV